MIGTGSIGTWPAALWLVRHGESAGNVARDAAEVAGAEVIAIDGRDVDVPLSPRGERQADALGAWFAAVPERERPSVVLASPYVRAKETAERLVNGSGLAKRADLVREVDERLREKEFGSLNRLTHKGITAKYPEEAQLYTLLGKFYYRPPGGESWCDVVLRLRSVLADVQLRYAGERVVIVAHQVIVLCFRYLLEHLDEAEILAIDRKGDIANCGITAYTLDEASGGRAALKLRYFNVVAPLEEAGAPVTKESDGTTGAK